MSAETPDGGGARVLALARALQAHQDLLDALRQRWDVHGVASREEALSALRTGLYDVVVATPTDLFPLARAEARERAEHIVEQIGQALYITDRQGTLVWGNARFRAFAGEVQDALRQQCAEVCSEMVIGATGTDPAARHRTVPIGDDHVFDLTVAPLMTAAQQVQEVVGLALDVTSRHRLQEKINAIDAAGRELVRLDTETIEQLDVGGRLALLEESINRYAHELLNFDHFVVRVLDKHTNKLETVVASGLPEEARSKTLFATVDGNGISGYVAATGRSYLCPDVSQDPRYLAGLDQAGSSLTVPLRLHDQVVGVLDVESEEVAGFTEDDRQFAEIFGRHIAIALHMLKLLAVERSTTTGQIADDVATELSVPLNDIVAIATRLIADRGAEGELRDRLQAIVDGVEQVKRRMQSITQVTGVRGLVPETTVIDPQLDGRRILVAEDEDIIRETISDVLAKGGALTTMARDGQEALAMIRSQHFDLVVSDIKMPYCTGYEVFAAARQANIHCPVILVTGFGYDPDHSIVRASKEGLAAVLFKPFKVEQLIDAVHQALQPAESS
ncbi:MAG: response regulator [Phycisphaerae bacterium]|jgi:CheY-like chemotaxis protein/GAF domain-containing protein